MLGVKCTLNAEDVNVTRPPPKVLNTTAPSVVSTAVADGGAVGGTVTVVAPGTVDAKMAEERMEDTLAARELDSDAALLCAGVEGVEVAEVVELLACLFFARWTSLLAMMGLSEWTCSMAARSLLKTPSWNLGDNECRTECSAAGSTESSNEEKASQSCSDRSSAGLNDGELNAPSSRLLKTNALRRAIMLVGGTEGKRIGPSEGRMCTRCSSE